MITLETQLKKLKHEVLKQVSILAKEDALNNNGLKKISYKIIKDDKPQYRCCIYKERAIVNQRTKLAIGCFPNDENMDDLVDIKGEDQILYVIPAACDSCPIDKYRVTEACRGCIEHRCMEVCPAKSIVKVVGRAYINQELCKECGLCKDVCPYNAIVEVTRPCKKSCPTGALHVGENERKAEIHNEDCVNCGACMAACPFGAISDKSFIVPVINELRSDRDVYAVVAPAIMSQFGPKVTLGQINNAMAKLGFKAMVEAACGADAVTVHEGLEFVERLGEGDKYMTNSCCPGFMSYIEKKFPSEVSKISGTVSPMIAAARMIKNKDKDAVVVFIGPCTAKKSEITRKSLKGVVDYVLTFEEIASVMDAYDIDPENLEVLKIEEASIYGRNFAQGGGLSLAVESFIDSKKIEIKFSPVKASGFGEIKKAMTMAKIGRLDGNFVEGMMCEGGCIGGPATLISLKKAKPLLVKGSNESGVKAVIDNEKLKEFEGVNLERRD